MKPHALNAQYFAGTPLTIQQNGQQKRDADLIARLRSSDEQALEQLYHHYYTRLYRFVSRITRREDIIDEVINDVMFVVWEKAATYDRNCKPSTWIFGIAFNKARQALRDEDRKQEESLEEIDEDNAWLGRPDAGLQQLELTDWLESALKILSPDQRAVIELTYFEGLHYSEIATIMNCPENTVKTRMFHARKNLASVLAPANDKPDLKP
jgi:RNA polymerase sigma factor (sigma-70 family)